jgi:hypothetical protein
MGSLSGLAESTVPKIHYLLYTRNDASHLSADEAHLQGMHSMAVTLVVNGILAVFMGYVIISQLSQNSSVHAAMFWILAAGSFHQKRIEPL